MKVAQRKMLGFIIMAVLPFAVAHAKVLDTYGQILNDTFPQGAVGYVDLKVLLYQNKDAKGTKADPTKDSPCYSTTVDNRKVWQFYPGACVHNISFIEYDFNNPQTGKNAKVVKEYTAGEVADSITILLPNSTVVTNSGASNICVQVGDSPITCQ